MSSPTTPATTMAEGTGQLMALTASTSDASQWCGNRKCCRPRATPTSPGSGPGCLLTITARARAASSTASSPPAKAACRLANDRLVLSSPGGATRTRVVDMPSSSPAHGSHDASDGLLATYVPRL